MKMMTYIFMIAVLFLSAGGVDAKGANNNIDQFEVSGEGWNPTVINLGKSRVGTVVVFLRDHFGNIVTEQTWENTFLARDTEVNFPLGPLYLSPANAPYYTDVVIYKPKGEKKRAFFEKLGAITFCIAPYTLQNSSCVR